MTVSFVARAVGASAVACVSIVLAQTPGPRAGPTVVPLDRVIAVVNDEALTQWDLREQKRVLLEQLKASNVSAPAADVPVELQGRHRAVGHPQRRPRDGHELRRVPLRRRLQTASVLQASGVRSDVTVFRLNAVALGESALEPAF